MFYWRTCREYTNLNLGVNGTIHLKFIFNRTGCENVYCVQLAFEDTVEANLFLQKQWMSESANYQTTALTLDVPALSFTAPNLHIMLPEILFFFSRFIYVKTS
jgi:hypothetical protein